MKGYLNSLLLMSGAEIGIAVAIAVAAEPRARLCAGMVVQLGIVAVSAGMLLSLSLVRYAFRGKAAVNFLILAPFLVPHIVLAVGIMLVIAPLGLLDSYPGIVLADFARPEAAAQAIEARHADLLQPGTRGRPAWVEDFSWPD